jgi:DNA-binding NtrC family response regulator
MMPDMYDLDVLQEIKSDKSLQHIPIIIQSGTHDVEEYNKAIKHGATTCFRKPYDRKSILLSIKNILDKTYAKQV